MDGIAAVEARVVEICRRFAPPAPPPAAGADFGAHLSRAMGARSIPPAAAGNVDAWIAEAIERTGVSPSWAPALHTIAERESSFNPAAVNLAASGGDPAKTPLGLMQMLPSTFAAHAEPGRGNIFDPVDNLSAAIDYIRDRYGDPAATPGLRALARGERYRGY